MYKLKEDTIYSQRELFKILNISQYTWERRKQDWLEYFETFCEYELSIAEHGQYMIKINHILENEYIPLPRKITRPPKEKIQKDYDKQTIVEIKKDPFQTVQLLAAKAPNGEYTAQYKHSHYTSEKYFRGSINNETLVHKGPKEWRRLVENGSVPLTKQQLVYLKTLMKEEFSGIETEQENICAAIEAGELTREEGNKELGAVALSAYYSALAIFEAEYHFRPKKISCCELSSFGGDLD